MTDKKVVRPAAMKKLAEPTGGLKGSKASPGARGKSDPVVRKRGTSLVKFGRNGVSVPIDTKKVQAGKVYEDNSSAGGRINASTGRNTSSLPGVTARTVTKQLNKSAKSAMASSAVKAKRAR